MQRHNKKEMLTVVDLQFVFIINVKEKLRVQP